MTPQLQQAIRLLQMPALELQAHIREQLESNVMLEPVDEYDATGTFEALEPHPMPEEKRVDAQPAPEVAVEAEVIEDAWNERSPGSDSWRDDDERAAEVADDVQLSLQDHLLGAARIREPGAARPRDRTRHCRCDQRRRLRHRFARRHRRHAAARSDRRCGRSRARAQARADARSAGRRRAQPERMSLAAAAHAASGYARTAARAWPSRTNISTCSPIAS